jgi:hypothetical protein
MSCMKTQREVIKELYGKHGNDLNRILKEVEEAVTRGEFRRKENAAGQTLRTYVSFLPEQGLAERGRGAGWLLKKRSAKAS